MEGWVVSGQFDRMIEGNGWRDGRIVGWRVKRKDGFRDG